MTSIIFYLIFFNPYASYGHSPSLLGEYTSLKACEEAKAKVASLGPGDTGVRQTLAKMVCIPKSGIK